MRVVGEDRWYHESNLVLCVYAQDEVFCANKQSRKQCELGMRSISSLLIHGIKKNGKEWGQWEFMRNFKQEDYLHN